MKRNLNANVNVCSVMVSKSARQAEGPRFDSRSRRPIFVCAVSYYLMSMALRSSICLATIRSRVRYPRCQLWDSRRICPKIWRKCICLSQEAELREIASLKSSFKSSMVVIKATIPTKSKQSEC